MDQQLEQYKMQEQENESQRLNKELVAQQQEFN